MKKLLLTLILAPLSVTAQECDRTCQIFRQEMGIPLPSPAPVYGLPAAPGLPIPQDKGPWGQGYSIVTTTKPKRNLWDRDMTGSETVQRVVPNDALGQPMRGLDLNW